MTHDRIELFDAKVGTAYRFTPRDPFTQQVSCSYVGVVVGPAEPPYGMKGVWVRVWRHAFDDERTERLDGPGYAVGWQPVEPASYTPELPDRYLEQGRLAV